MTWGTVYIEGVNGRIQTGTYRHPLAIVIALNIRLINESDSLTVRNSWGRNATVSKINVGSKMVTLHVSSWLCTELLFHYIFENGFMNLQ